MLNFKLRESLKLQKSLGFTQTVPVSIPLTDSVKKSLFPTPPPLYQSSVSPTHNGVIFNIANTFPPGISSFQIPPPINSSSLAKPQTSREQSATPVPLPPPPTAPAMTANIPSQPDVENLAIPHTSNHPLFSFTNKPESKVLLTKSIRYETWRNYWRLALDSAGLLYLVDPTIPRPSFLTPEIERNHKSRFCGIIGERLQPADLNKIGHITEPVELLQTLDRLKRPPFYARAEDCTYRLHNLRYRSIKVSPYSYILLFEKHLQECTLAGTTFSESYVSTRFFESVVGVLPHLMDFNFNYKLTMRLPFVPYEVLKDVSTGAVLYRQRFGADNASLQAYHTGSGNTPNKGDNSNHKTKSRKSNAKRVKDKQNNTNEFFPGTPQPCRRCSNATHSHDDCPNKICPSCRKRQVDKKHIETCAMKKSNQSSQTSDKNMNRGRNGRSYGHSDNRPYHGRRDEYKFVCNAPDGNNPPRVHPPPNNQQSGKNRDSRNESSTSSSNPPSPDLTARYVRYDNGRMVFCNADDDQVYLLEFNPQGNTQNSVSFTCRTIGCLDSGCNLFLFYDSHGLTNVRKLNQPHIIQVANSDQNANLITDTVGDLKIRLLDGSNMKLTPVHVNNKVSENFIPVRHFTNLGHPVIFFNSSVHILAKNSIAPTNIKPILSGKSDGTLWYLNITTPCSSVNHVKAQKRKYTSPNALDSALPNSSDDTILTFDQIKTNTQFFDYLSNIPHCTLSDLKKLEEQEIRSIRGQLGRLWHFRLGHACVQVLRDLAKTLPELKGVTFPLSIQDCHACKTAKATKIPHKSICRRAQKPFELIHTDVQGDIFPPAYPGNERYILAIVDDYTRYGFLYIMKDKTQVRLGLKAFYEEMKRIVPYSFQIQYIRMDNGTEYKTKDVQKFLNDHKIKEDKSPPCTSPLNGTAERFLRTIRNCTHALLVDSGLPKRTWAYAAKYACLIYNSLPKVACNGQIPHYLVHQTTPTLKYLRRFGCVVHVTLPKQVGKFSDRVLRKYFIGLTSNGALLLDVSTGDVKPASNVTFTESQVYGHHYGPFERTKFNDPIKLKRSSNNWFNPKHDHLHNIALNPKFSKHSPMVSTHDDPISELNHHLVNTYESELIRHKIPLNNSSQLLYPQHPALPALQCTDLHYSPKTVDDSQVLVASHH